MSDSIVLTGGSVLNIEKMKAFVSAKWKTSVIDELESYIRIPAKSPAFDPAWAKHGYLRQVIQNGADWARRHAPKSATITTHQLPHRTPTLTIDIPGTVPGNILLYGHLDKQPEMSGWREGLGPWKPVLKDGKLYGRGAADDGYALYAAVTAIASLNEQKIPHPRCLILIETSEESGSVDLTAYTEVLADLIATPDVVICLDSGAGNYEQMWLTTSLRGLINGTLRVDVLHEGLHSGDASGIVPDSFRIARTLIDRLEDSESGILRPDWLSVEIPREKQAQARAAAVVIGRELFKQFPWAGETQPSELDISEALLNRSWRSTLTVTGGENLPPSQNAGNVLRAYTTLCLSLRLPPPLDAKATIDKMYELLGTNIPYQAKVDLQLDGYSGWEAPMLRPWLHQAISEASLSSFGQPAMYRGEGFSIPFMSMLGRAFPQAQFVITGVLGPESNAHGPNEFLHIEMAERLTGAIAQILERCGHRASMRNHLR